jgi:hypothetical protein
VRTCGSVLWGCAQVTPDEVRGHAVRIAGSRRAAASRLRDEADPIVRRNRTGAVRASSAVNGGHEVRGIVNGQCPDCKRSGTFRGSTHSPSTGTCVSFAISGAPFDRGAGDLTTNRMAWTVARSADEISVVYRIERGARF